MKAGKIFIIVVSIAVPIVVAVLFFTTKTETDLGDWVHQLPAFNATVNSVVVVLLVSALIAIKNGKEQLHRNLMLSAMLLGVVFLISYVTYHSSVPSTLFGDVNGDHALSPQEREAAGSLRTVYLIVLLSHILFSVFALPLIITAAYLGLSNNRIKHRKLVRFSYPIWLYVAVTGVVVYFLISPYY